MKTTIYFLLILACTSSSWFTKQGLFAQNVGINGTGATAHPSALLDLDASSSPSVGLLVPRISLSLTTLPAPVTSPANSLLVYNLATTSGTAAVSPGFYYWDGTKWVRLQTTNNAANDWNLLGNAGTVDGTNFIGTTDNVPLNIRVNNQKAGRIDNILGNTFLGVLGGNANTTASANTAIGALALLTNSTGVQNTAIGVNALAASTTGNDNVAVGYYSGTNNTIGVNNTFLGVYADATVGTFTNATAIGYNAKVGQSNALILGGTGTNSVNVGIGTATPSEKLEIQGSVKIVDGTQAAGRVLVSDANGKGSWADPTDASNDQSSVIVGPVATSTSIIGTSITLAKGVYYVQPYNLLQGMTYSNSYYANIDVLASSGTLLNISNGINRDFSTLASSPDGYYTMPGFIIKITSATATVALRITHGNGGTMSLSSTMTLIAYFTKIN